MAIFAMTVYQDPAPEPRIDIRAEVDSEGDFGVWVKGPGDEKEVLVFRIYRTGQVTLLFKEGSSLSCLRT